MAKTIQFVAFHDIDWVQRMVDLVSIIDPNKSSTWTTRLNLEYQSKLTWYIISLGQFMREMEAEYNTVLLKHRTATKTKADAEILAKQSIAYSNWKLSKTYREDLTNLVYALRAEVRLEHQDVTLS